MCNDWELCETELWRRTVFDFQFSRFFFSFKIFLGGTRLKFHPVMDLGVHGCMFFFCFHELKYVASAPQNISTTKNVYCILWCFLCPLDKHYLSRLRVYFQVFDTRLKGGPKACCLISQRFASISRHSVIRTATIRCDILSNHKVLTGYISSLQTCAGG